MSKEELRLTTLKALIQDSRTLLRLKMSMLTTKS